jgi:antirestriction protein ArdC
MREELVAETGSAFLCGHCGIDTNTVENSASYINDWIKLLKEDKRLVITASAQGQKAADYVLGKSKLSY